MLRLLFCVWIWMMLCPNLKAQEYRWAFDFGRFVDLEEILEAPNGNIIVAGSFDNLDFLGTNYQSPSGASSFIAAYSATGEEQWIKVFTGDDEEEVLAMERDAAGNLYLLVRSQGMSSYQGTSISDQGGEFLMKLDPQGNLLWFENQFVYGDDLDNRLDGSINLTDIAVSPSGQLYLALGLDGELEFEGVTYVSRDNTRGRSTGDPFLIKYKSNTTIDWAILGDSQWEESPAEDDKTFEIELDSQGNLLMAGTFDDRGSAELGLTFGTLTRLPVGQNGNGVFLVKFNPNGTPLWIKGFADDEANNADVEAEQLKDIITQGEDIYLSINFSDDINFGNVQIENPGPNRGDFPFDGNVVCKLNANGDLQWYQVFSTLDAQAQISLSPLDKSLNVLGAYDKVSFPQAGRTLQDNRTDYFIAQIDSLGNLIDLDSTEFTPVNRDVFSDKHPFRHLADGSLVMGLRFEGGGLILNNLTLSDANAVLALRNPNLPFFVNLGPDTGACQEAVTLDAEVPSASSYLWSTGATSPSIQVNQTGTYWVQVQDQDDKQASDTIQVTIEEPLVFQLPDTLFGISSVEISAPLTAFGYLWSTGATGPSITVSQGGWYGLTVFTEFGCETEDSTFVVLEELSIYQGGSGSGDARAILENTQAFYTGGSFGGYSSIQLFNQGAFYQGGLGDGYSFDTISGENAFYLGSIGQGYAISALASAGSFFRGGQGSGYDVFQTDLLMSFFRGSQGSGYDVWETEQQRAFYQGGIGDGYALQDKVEEVITSIRQALPQFRIKVFPNPAQDSVFIRPENADAKLSQIKIYDSQGNLVLSRSLDAQEIRLGVQNLSPGVYLLELLGPDIVPRQTLRLVIQ